MHRFLPIAVTACALLWSAAATAQPALYDGERLIREGRYKDALGLLLPAYMNDPTAELAYAIARAYDGSRDDPRALKFYQSSLAQRGLSRKGRKHAKRRIRSIKSRLKNRPRKATLSLKSSAPGALVRVNGAEIGRTPLSGVLIPPGRHVVTVTHDAWETWEKQVNVAPFDQVHLDAEMVDRPTDVLVHTEPAGANAIMANGQRCVTPCLFSLRGGNYKLTVTRDGYRPLVHDFVKPPGQLLELRLRLVPLGAGPVTMRGYLQVNVDRPGANILVDGQAVARSPTAQPLAVVPGTHRVSVALQGFQPWVGDVQIAPAQTTTIAVQLVPTGAVTPVRNPPTQPIAVNVPVRQPDPVRPTPIGATGPGGGEPDTALGWGLLGGGIAAVLGGGGLTTVALLQQREFNTAVRFKIEEELYVSGLTRADVIALEDQANVMMIASYGLYAVGAGLIVAGIVVLTSEPDPDPNNRLRAPSLGVAPLIGPGITGAQAEWRF